LPENQIEFDFLGKDSMRYHNVVTIIPEVWRNIEIFMQKKQPTDNIFDKIDTQALNDYLKELLEGLTAKVFRTYNASSTLQNELNKCQLDGLTMDEKYAKYKEANKQVAILCNHQKTVSKKVVESMAKKEKYIQILRDNLAELNKHKSHFTAKKDTINREDLTVEFDGKPISLKFPSSKEKTIVELKKLEEKISKEESNYLINLRTAERKGRRERHSFRHFKDELQRPKNFSGMVQSQRSQD
jgi:DNA topoisomerase-1